eukprot:10867872-Ditylum_brightwellii.AAC.1
MDVVHIAGVLELGVGSVKALLHIPWHHEINISFAVVPFKGETTNHLHRGQSWCIWCNASIGHWKIGSSGSLPLVGILKAG